ncbi:MULTISPECIES: ABC transporter permease [Rhizobium/Agrobacterium group]|uniref:ABC transporter permease n=2 Tax=Agrobacterium tumefaciens complex TaxID=1183400 RepID=A0AAE6EM97_AGRTU|nr:MULTISPECIES: ABC transporter permease [Rhizobium/Agrobacterium group]KRA68625.1 ABC transporter permease [Rhizobium sp. Root651]MCA2371835.1 ABC transporter permease [Agrobacterium tomkonis CIP 111-78]MCZ7455637.1 ABC transporter permease [Rhizobium rhizogenes]QCL91403.1 ABC transporter permease [Agrobacterium tumefaciens]QCM02390.1 ABC transporter permease [Agrobacterium tumefaciens]
MSDIAIMKPHALPRRGISGWKAIERRLFSPGILILPLLIFLTIFFFWPAIRLMTFSVMTQNSQGLIGSPFTLAHYVRFFEVDLYQKVLWATIRISLVTSIIAAILAYPVATVLVRGNIATTRIITLIVIAPLAVSVVVRAYGWQLILGNGPTGLLNYVLMNLGIIDSPLTLLFSDAAVIIGSLHIFFPMMVLPLSSALGKIDPNLQQAARTLGAPAWKVFLRITFPLSLPGLVAGFTLVFSLASASYVIPALIGGPGSQMLGNMVEQQVLAVYDWPFGATIATILVFIVILINAVSMRLLGGRRIKASAS